MNAREILIYLSLKFNGDYRRIREAIEKHEYIDDDIDIPKTDYKAVTIVDEDYPEELKRYTMCPIVLFYYGNLSLIKDINKNLAVIGSRITTEYGSEATKEIVKDVAKDVVIVSGMVITLITSSTVSSFFFSGLMKRPALRIKKLNNPLKRISV